MRHDPVLRRRLRRSPGRATSRAERATGALWSATISAVGTKRNKQHQKQFDIVRSHEAALRENRCPPALLHQLALAYFGLLIEANGNTPTDRLRSLFRGDERLEGGCVSQGFAARSHRADLPNCRRGHQLCEIGDMEHYLALPALASLEELEKETPTDLRRLDTKSIARRS